MSEEIRKSGKGKKTSDSAGDAIGAESGGGDHAEECYSGLTGPGARGRAWPPPKMNITGKLGLVKFNPDDNSHLRVLDPQVCRERCPQKFCTHACPAQVYRWEEEESLISVAFEGCLECGTCRSGGCPFNNIEMRYPRGGFGVQYRFG